MPSSIPKFKQILITTDLECASPVSVLAGVALAKSMSASVALVHVVANLPRSGMPTTKIEACEESLLGTARERLTAMADSFGIRTSDTYLRRGNVGIGILATAAELHADLIVVSSRGGRDTEGPMWLGSIAARVAHDTPCPLLVVRDEHPVPESGRFKRPLVGADFSLLTEATALVTAAVSADDAPVTLCYVVFRPTFAGESEKDRKALDEVFENAHAKDLKRLSELVEKLPGENRFQGRVEVGRAAEVLVRAIADTEADLVVVGAHSGDSTLPLGTVGDHLLRYSRVPVLLVPKRTADAMLMS